MQTSTPNALMVNPSAELGAALTADLRTGLAKEHLLTSIEVVDSLPSITIDAEFINRQAVRSQVPALVILDYATLPQPILPAVSVLWEAYQHYGSAVLLMLPAEDEAAFIQATNMKVDDFCTYPINPAKFGYRIRTVLRHQRIRLQEQHTLEQLNETQQRYQIIANMITNYLYCNHRFPDGRFVRDWQDEDGFLALTGYTFAEVDAIGGWNSIVYPEDLPLVLQHQERAVRERLSQADFRIITRKNKVVWLREYVRTATLPNGATQINGGLQDISDLKIAESTATIQMQMVDALQSTAIALSSTLDLDEVLDRILSNLEIVIPYDLADVMLIEDGWTYIARHRGYTERHLEHIIPIAQFKIDDTPNLRNIRDSHIPYVSSDVDADHGWVRIADMDWIRSYMGAPLYVNDELAGFLNLNSQRVGYFTSEDANRLQVFATQVSAAITNARLHATVLAQAKRLEEQYQEMDALYRATDALFDAETLEELAYQITETIVTEFNQVDCGMMVLNDLKDTIIRVARAGSRNLETPKERPVAGKGLVPLAIRSGQTLYAPDVWKHPDYAANVPTTNSELVIPLYTHEGVIGALDLQSPDFDAFTEQERRIIKTYAERVSAAVETTMLLEQIRRHASELERRVQDRTHDLRLALDRERELGDLKSRFITMVSHQFRTPLTAILSAKELLERYSERMTPEQREERYKLIDTAVDDMVRFLEDALTINLLAEDKHAYNMTLVDLNSLTRTIVEDFSDQHAKYHEIIYRADREEHLALIDSEIWRRILRELLLNAVKFSDPRSTIICQLASNPQRHILTIEDEGIGIPPADLDRVFSTFDRGTNVENIPGAGLGLAIVKQTIERQGGEVHLISELHKGTKVTLILPKYLAEGMQ